MKKQLKALIFVQLIMCSIFFETYAARGYTKKTPYAGMGKVSKANGRIKVKGISGHGKRTSKGYTYVNPYSRTR